MKAFTWDLADDGCSARLLSALGAFPSVVWILRQAAATPDVVLGAECDAVAAGEVFGAEVWPELLQPAARIMSAARAGMTMKPRSANLCMPLLLRFPSVERRSSPEGCGPRARRNWCSGDVPDLPIGSASAWLTSRL